MTQADLHVHSRYSTRPSQWFLQKIGCPESFTDPLHLYHIARRRGMTLVTITDHNRIEGALEIAHLDGTFISEEITSYFPEDQCKVHVLAYNITERQHTDIQKARENLYDLIAYLREASIRFALAHPMYSVNDRLTVDHFEKTLLLFKNFELNGDANPEVNDSLRIILASLTRADIERVANKHGLHPEMEKPWVKNLVGGSDDHSSLNIARNCTRVEGVDTVHDFLKGIEEGRAEVVERPSSPQTMAHNLYSIAYQFYRNKLSLGSNVPNNFLLKYVDACLRCADETEAGFFNRLHFLWQYRRIRQIRGSIPEPMAELLRKETAKLIAEEPALFALPQKGDRLTQRIEGRWFGFMDKMSSRILLGFANHLMDHFSGANLFNIFHTIGSAGGFCTLLAPYFVAFAHHNEQRCLKRDLMARFAKAPDPGNDSENAANLSVFSDRLEDAWGSDAKPFTGYPNSHGTILTCDPAAGARLAGVKLFRPIGVYEFKEIPGHRLIYPPVLEMLDYCYAADFNRIHLATAGPTGLTGLFIARFLKIPVEATFSDLLPVYARFITGDGFIEDLSWKYTVWFYNQMDAVYVTSGAARYDLAGKGISREKIKVVPSSAEIRPIASALSSGPVSMRRWQDKAMDTPLDQVAV